MYTTKTDLLYTMCTCYMIPILYVAYQYDNNQTISSIISLEENRMIIFTPMICMCLCAIYYEVLRDCTFSFFTMLGLVIGIFGSILVSEKQEEHFRYAELVFISILLFMGNHCIQKRDGFSIMMFLLQFDILIYLMNYCIIEPENCTDNSVFVAEVFYLLLFAIYYLYLHFVGK